MLRMTSTRSTTNNKRDHIWSYYIVNVSDLDKQKRYTFYLRADERCGGWCACAGDLMLEMRSSRSSLKERARRASLLAPRNEPRCPDPGSPQASSAIN